MEVYTWLNPISTKAELTALIALAEEGTIEELFIAQSTDANIIEKNWPVGQILIFSFSASLEAEQHLNKVSTCVNLDTLDDKYFKEVDDVYVLKSVFYPESDDQEEQIIAQLR